MQKMFYFQRFRNFVLALSGVHVETLKLVPSERPRFESLGWSILITSGLAVISMWFALASAMNVNGVIAVPIALCWGLVIMGIDRWLVTSMPIDSNRKFALSVPRILLALLLGTLISTPIVLRIFQSEINAQVAVMQQDSYNTFLKQQQGSQVAKQVSTYSRELQYLNTVINSKGTVTANTAADPEIVGYNKQLTALQAQLATWTQAENQDLKEYSCQRYGGANCPKAGVGPAAKASLSGYQQAKAQVAKVQGQIDQVQQKIRARTKALTSTSKSAALNRYQQALAKRPTVQNEYQAAIQRQNQLQAVFYAQNQAAHGLLTKLEALSELSNSNTTVAAARFLLFLLFLVIECLPVTVKLLQKPGHYEAALAKAKSAESRDVEEYYNDGSGLGASYPAPAFAAPYPDAAPVPSSPAGAAPAQETRRQRRQRRQAEEDRAVASVFSVWHPTKVLPHVVGDPDDDVSTQVLSRSSGESASGFPPSEVNQASRSGWGPADDEGQPDDQDEGGLPRHDGAGGWGRAREDTRPHASGPDERMADISAMWTRQDPLMPETRMDDGHSSQAQDSGAYQATAQARRGRGDSPQDRELHDTLREFDDDAPFLTDASDDIGEMALNWDEE